jgi:hypothetical protein
MRPCRVCGKPLGGGPWWLVQAPDIGEHDHCRDWSKHPFPYSRDLTRLRAAARSLKALERRLVATGRMLAQAEKMWPDRAGERVEQCTAAMAKLREDWEAFVARGSPVPRA